MANAEALPGVAPVAGARIFKRAKLVSTRQDPLAI